MVWFVVIFFLVTVAFVLLIVWLKRGASNINDYFCNAVIVYTVTGDEPTRLAALTAAKVAASQQRASMLLYLRGMASEMATHPGGDIMRSRLLELTEEIAVKDWNMRDIRVQKAILGEVDAEYLEALNRYDPKVFQKRWPALSDETKRR